MSEAVEVGKRLILFRNSLGYNKQGDFLEEIEKRVGPGITQGNISHWELGKYIPKRDKLVLLISAFPQLNESWLLTGEGEMLKSPATKVDQKSYTFEKPDQKKDPDYWKDKYIDLLEKYNNLK